MKASPPLRSASCLVVLLLVTAGRGSSGAQRGPTPPPSITSAPTATAITPSPTASASCAERVFEGMTEEQRVGQLFLVGLEGDQLQPDLAAAIRAKHFGSVWFIETTSVGVTGIREVADAVQALATPEATAGVRFFVAANQEGGLIQALRGSGFSVIPTAVDQGHLAPSVLKGDAAEWGRQLAAAGVNMNFAPVMDVVPADAVADNQPIGVLKREFGNEPATAGSHGVAFLRGMAQAGVATTAKHFPGLGHVQGNTDFTANVVDTVTGPDDPDLESFRQAIQAGVPFVMVALATYTRIDPANLAAFSPTVISLLREDLDFSGVIVSDDLGETKAVADIPPGDRAVRFLSAGGDMIISKTLSPAIDMARALVAKTAADPAFRATVDGAALLVLQAKAAADLLPCSG